MVARTKSKIACFAAPSFHDASRPGAGLNCASAGAAATIEATIAARKPWSIRRPTSDQSRDCFMAYAPLCAMAV
jgi:hypothetical protein